MPGPSATLFNHTTNTYEDVPAEQVSAALASGQYTAAGQTTTTQAEGGQVVRPVEQAGAAVIQGESSAGSANAARAAEARREEQKALDSDRVLSFVEGAGDALTIGLMHGSREEDDLRREANSGSALLGQLLGTAAGLHFPGPIKGITEGGSALGEGVARALLGEAETGFKGVVTRGIQEAAANSALMAASAFGHQITDAVVANKPFAAESVLHEAGVGALLGFGAGFAGSAFGQLAKASRGAVEASGVAIKESDAALAAVQDLTGQWDGVVEQHAQRVGVLRVLSDEGHVPGDFHAERAQALGEAERARDALRNLDPVRSLGGDPTEFQKWRGAVERYQDAVTRLDDQMAPSMLERASNNPVKLGDAADIPRTPVVPHDIDQVMADQGFRSPMSSELDSAMTPEARAKYAEIYGRPFEETPGVGGARAADEANLGGQQSGTSELGTNPGTRRRGATPAPAPEADTIVDHKAMTGPDTVVDPRVERFNKGLGEVRAPRDTVIDAESQAAGPRHVIEAGEPPANSAATGADFVATTKNNFLGLKAGEEVPGAPSMEGKKAVRDYMNNWFKEFDSKPRVSIGDQLKVRLSESLDNIAKASGGRLDSAGGLALLKSLGLKEATSPLGQRLDQVWSLGQAGRFAADESRGIKTPLRKGLVGQLQRYATHKGARAIGGAMMGASIGGPVGAIVGMALTSAGLAGKIAGTAGKLMQQVATVGEALLKGTRATLAVRAVTGNRPYQYSDKGPIKNPVLRILEVQRLAANPAAIRARVTHQLGDLSLTSPDMAQSLLDSAVNHVQSIAASAPAIMFTPLGKPIPPSSTALNRFIGFENAMHDLPGTLQAIGQGAATIAQLKSLQIGFPAVHAELVRNIVGQTTRLDALDEAKLRTMEMALGVPLTRATADPRVTARFQGNWNAPKPAQQAPQSFKITAPAPTPVQASSGGRAPGNERKAP